VQSGCVVVVQPAFSETLAMYWRDIQGRCFVYFLSSLVGTERQFALQKILVTMWFEIRVLELQYKFRVSRLQTGDLVGANYCKNSLRSGSAHLTNPAMRPPAFANLLLLQEESQELQHKAVLLYWVLTNDDGEHGVQTIRHQCQIVCKARHFHTGAEVSGHFGTTLWKIGLVLHLRISELLLLTW